MSHTALPITPIVDALVEEWSALEAIATSMTDEQWSAPSVLPGWTVADVIAHIIGTESMLAGRDVEVRRDLAALDHVRNPIGELNEKWLDHFRDRPRTEVMAAFADIIAARTNALRAMTQTDFDADTITPAGPDTYGRFMRIRIFDCWMHEIDIIDSSTESGSATTVSLAAAPTTWALEEIAASMPFVVGKRARTPQGTSILIRVGGVAPREMRIVVEERAAAVDAFDGGDESADVTLTLDDIDLARLVGGRRSADPTRVTIDGNVEFGRAIVENAAYVI
ncbi:maleylpyruvate isomerase family mycothiol-dependent enzyme [Gordonia sp. CPCC 205515]|uniref:maleylpyruvate isomerase family mycothiol-dependent enzyme n=1 Tax=Gordonia sp. CPCC 205515 TaxID=3140791 RepID=UPI003AF36D3C